LRIPLKEGIRVKAEGIRGEREGDFTDNYIPRPHWYESFLKDPIPGWYQNSKTYAIPGIGR
jgi:hypothetical protein